MSWLALAVLSASWAGGVQQVEMSQVDGGRVLTVDGEPFLVKGVNWGYVPIGENYSYDFWGEPDAFIERALREEMPLLQAAGINAIRVYPGIPRKWVTWIHDNYGVYTVINPTLGRYGTTVNGRFVPVVDYSDPTMRQAILDEIRTLVAEYKDTPGLLMWFLGNENNYGLAWDSFEIQALPKDQRDAAKARYLYSLVGEAVDVVHGLDSQHPVAFVNGDLQYLDLIKAEADNLDLLATNVYRGASARDLYQRVEDELGKAVLFAEFGADAYDAAAGREDHLTQARYLRAQWQEVYEQTAGKGRVGNCVGGMTFQWSDGWWKYKQEEDLDVHNNNASWPNDAYPEDYREGFNNMNEEWFGITAKGPRRADGTFPVFPRAGYYVLKDAYRLDPYAETTTLETIRAHFDAIDVTSYDGDYRGSLAMGQLALMSRVGLRDVRMELSSYYVDQRNEDASTGEPTLDHTESFFVDFGVQPSDDFQANVVVNVLGNVANNRIDPIFYEARGRAAQTEDGVDPTVLERVKVYGASVTWNTEFFELDGFYRTGHYHWGYEGDFFGLYPEANYGPNLDIYNGSAPIGVEFTGKKALDGFKLAIGPELYWGANPGMMAKYHKEFGTFEAAVVHQEDFTRQGGIQTSNAIAGQVSRRTTLHVGGTMGPVTVDLGGVMSNTNRIGRTYYATVEAEDGEQSYLDSGMHVLTDEVELLDTLGAKARVKIEGGPVQFYAQGVYKGLVADTGTDPTVTFTGWSLKEAGLGNHYGVTTGLALRLGNFQIAPNFLYQKPLVGPLTPIDGAYDAETGWYYPGMQARNLLDTAFAVLGNRETTAFELLLVFDPTPGSWFWAWDNAFREDAGFAFSIDAVYRIQPTSTDGNFGFTADGTLFAFTSAPPAQDVWDVTSRFIVNPGAGIRVVGNAYVGQAQSTGDDDRLITRSGVGASIYWRTMNADLQAKFNDWGPYDYHRTFNFTHPLQLIGNVSYGVIMPRLYLFYPRIGLSAKYRTLDQYSDGFVPDPADPDALGSELEIGAYLNVSL